MGLRDARGSKVKGTDDHMQCLQKCLAGEQPPPTAVATAEVIGTPSNRVRNVPLYLTAVAPIAADFS
jgi:hypothetical protein